MEYNKTLRQYCSLGTLSVSWLPCIDQVFTSINPWFCSLVEHQLIQKPQIEWNLLENHHLAFLYLWLLQNLANKTWDDCSCWFKDYILLFFQIHRLEWRALSHCTEWLSSCSQALARCHTAGLLLSPRVLFYFLGVLVGNLNYLPCNSSRSHEPQRSRKDTMKLALIQCYQEMLSNEVPLSKVNEYIVIMLTTR